MINPRWLAAANIIENTAINYDADEDLANFVSPPTSVVAHPYRQFVSQFPDRTSYFQPILEKIDKVASLISPDGPVIVTEGISDFHAFMHYCGELLKENGISLLPGLGDKSLDPLISNLIGKAQNFIVVLDADKSGIEAVKGYRERWLLDESRIVSYGDLESSASGKKLEQLLSVDTHNTICSHFGKPGGNASKKEIGLFYAEAASGIATDNCVATTKTFQGIASKAITNLKSQAS